MPQRTVPLLAPPPRKANPEALGSYETKARGMAVLTNSLLNKGTAFTSEEREALGLTGLLPPVINTLEAQAACACAKYQRLPDALSKRIYLIALHDRNEVLFFHLLSGHLREMISVINDRTAGLAMELVHAECRRPRGVYLSIDQPGEIEAAFKNFGAGPGDIDLIMATDAEQISGIGDWGVGGIESCISKLAIYTAAGGIDPARVIPVMLDVGTNRESLLADPVYPGDRHARVRGERYNNFIDAYVRVATKLFPHALLQWEDFAPGNGRRILEKYRGQVRTFNENLQGAGAITLAAAISAMRVLGTRLRDQRIVIFGAGSAAIGIADLMREVMIREGLSADNATRQFWFVGPDGLLVEGSSSSPHEHGVDYARPAADVRRWSGDGTANGIQLNEVIRRVRPAMLIGASGIAGAFTEAIVRDMAQYTKRPIIFPLSAPASSAEAAPADLVVWTDGRALIATGCPFMPVTFNGVTYVIGKTNNVMLYPGLGLGTIVSRARIVSTGMLAAAANTLSGMVAVRLPGAPLLPHVDDLRNLTVAVAVAVAEAAVEEGLAGVALPDIAQQVADAMWQPAYRRIQAAC